MSSGPPPVPGRSPEEREAARRAREARRDARGGKVPPPVPEAPQEWLDEATPRGRPTARRVGRQQTKAAKAPKPPKAAKPPKAPKPPKPTRAARPPKPPRPPKAPRTEGASRAPARIAALALLGLVVLAGAWFALSLFQPFTGEGDGRVRVVVPKGATLSQIGDRLAENEVISRPSFFQLRARVSGRGGNLKPGSYRLKRGMSYVAALDALEKGPPPDVLMVTVPEGRSRREVAALTSRLEGSYVAATRRSRALDPRRYGGRRARDLEGFLFPATYELKKRQPVDRLVELQLAAFKREWAKVDLGYARGKRLSAYDVLTIASLVEREAQLPKERRLVASVIYNRLRDGMRLDIDASTRFAVKNWSKPLTRSQIESPSPYNTRRSPGLPPGPIGSPGLASMKAAARPARTDFLFYVVKPGTCGEHDFSATYEEQQRKAARYEQERQRRGGRSPTKC